MGNIYRQFHIASQDNHILVKVPVGYLYVKVLYGIKAHLLYQNHQLHSHIFRLFLQNVFRKISLLLLYLWENIQG